MKVAQIKDHDHRYEIHWNEETDFVGVWNKKREKYQKITRENKGNRYGRVYLVKNETGERVPHRLARLVATAWIPNPQNKPFVDHIDRNIANDTVSNLRWVTRSENNLNRRAWGRGYVMAQGKYPFVYACRSSIFCKTEKEAIELVNRLHRNKGV